MKIRNIWSEMQNATRMWSRTGRDNFLVSGLGRSSKIPRLVPQMHPRAILESC
jgi:hypothetical protein